MFSVFVLGILLQIVLMLCHDSEAAKRLSDSVVAPIKGRRGGSVDLELHAMYNPDK